jgi:ATP-dependent Clp protease adaptor protein ClpS
LVARRPFPHLAKLRASPLFLINGHPVISSLLPAVAPPTSGQPLVGSTFPSRATATPGANPGGAAVLDKAPERVRKPSPRYKVLLHNDPVNSMEYVVATLRQVVPSLSEQDAIAVMLETHNTGVGLVIVCDIEPAEFYCETLKAKGLTSTIEPES